MPAVRMTQRRRRSSLAVSSFNPVKAGTYGIKNESAPSPKIVTFAPNVTPGTYCEPEPASPDSPELSEEASKLFPPSATPAPPPTRRRVPPGKRRSMGYIPRPPNAFMLFRADFVRQKHVPGSIEQNHGSLSKIIGSCWRNLPLEEKRVWEVRAKHAKAEHKKLYPEYRFRPIHNKNKEKKEKALTTPDDERRCEEVAALLLEGKKGDELAAAVADLDRLKSETPDAMSAPQYAYGHRRSSSVPLPDYRYNGIALPALPFLNPASRCVSPTQDMRMMYGQRRASSVQPMPSRSWMMPIPSMDSRDVSPLPEVNDNIFDPSWTGGASNFSFGQPQEEQFPNFSDFLTNLPPNVQNTNDMGVMSPMENVAPHELLNHGPMSQVPFSQLHPQPELDPNTWLPLDSTHSDPSSTYSGSPAPSETSLPVHAPQPQHLNASTPFGVWNSGYEMAEATPEQQQQMQMQMQLQEHHEYQQPQPEYAQTYNQGLQMDYSQAHEQQQTCAPDLAMHNYAAPALDTLFEPSSYGGDMMSPPQDQGLEYQFNDMVHDYPSH